MKKKSTKISAELLSLPPKWHSSSGSLIEVVRERPGDKSVTRHLWRASSRIVWFVSWCGWDMSLLSVFPPPPATGEVTLCEINAKLVSESFETADLSRYIPAKQVSLQRQYFNILSLALLHLAKTCGSLWRIKLWGKRIEWQRRGGHVDVTWNDLYRNLT